MSHELKLPNVVNIEDIEEQDQSVEDVWGTGFKPITPMLDDSSGARLGMNLTRVEKGKVSCPVHYHLNEDEAFYILSGKGVFRYGEQYQVVGPGDCISCPAGTQIGHQFANPFDEDLVYIGAGMNTKNEVCVYPDTGKAMVRGLRTVGTLQSEDLHDGEPVPPVIFSKALKTIN
ncbi:cupin domain-containing protein [Pseudoalteromonas luteoviolacea]|uniref:Cupin type-2 domain-containing protein n=1 Tax=Pseudoalteromonas luteoviolacea NCIMB 1942 TaxID=1365253 RepID=A0A167CLR9_9GAMM|nr:cupin domain-containing protein [Pseudoalteromonas luteoviolacea]KZN47814.1 hypothetical protein N482_08865 [Pseudoalteromonas luteoviolacea NCIMB 1942]